MNNYEDDIYEWLKSLDSNLTILRNDNTLIGTPLTFYMPEKKIAITFNKTDEHIEGKVDAFFHQNQSKECKEKGVHLVHIFEYEWKVKSDKLKDYIQDLLGIGTKKYYARTCQVWEIQGGESLRFLDRNHLQGADRAAVKLGLYYKGHLVSVMTFAKPRFNKKFEWELSRFASVKQTRVLGGASKLFEYFIKHYNPKSIITYSDFAKMSGNLYLTLGFKYRELANPNYVWIQGDEVLTRYKCQKKVLERKGYSGTEKSIMQGRGFTKLYDSGNMVFEWVGDNEIG